jgi:hypothetical protein
MIKGATIQRCALLVSNTAYSTNAIQLNQKVNWMTFLFLALANASKAIKAGLNTKVL